MTSPTASDMGKRSHALRRQRLGEAEYRRRQAEYAKLGGAAGKGKKRPRPTP